MSWGGHQINSGQLRGDEEGVGRYEERGRGNDYLGAGKGEVKKGLQEKKEWKGQEVYQDVTISVTLTKKTLHTGYKPC